jgi:hypothetical protein
MNAIIEKTVPNIVNLPQWLDYARWSVQQHEIAHSAWTTQAVRSGFPDALELSRVAKSHYRLASAGIRHLSSLVKQLAVLRECEETDDYGVLRASERAYNEACQLLVDATITAAVEGRELPDGCVSTDSEGGVRIEWVRPHSSVRLVIPAAPARQPYLYHEVGDAYATDHPTAEALAHWLREID